MEPTLTMTEMSGVPVAELADGTIASERDAIDLVGNASYLGARFVLLEAEQLSPEFFDLSSGLAGAVLQKFSTFQLGLVVVGYDRSRASDSLRALMSETNRGRSVWFVGDREEALVRLAAL